MIEEFEITKTFKVKYEVKNSMITVEVEGMGRKETQLGDSPAKSLADLLASEIIRQARID